MDLSLVNSYVKYTCNEWVINIMYGLRVNVSKNQTKIENSWPQSKNRFGLFFVQGKAKVLPSVKWN